MAARQFGDCSLCCKLLRIPELDKPKDQWCPNFTPGTGCGIYAERPPSCRDFVCRWLINPSLGPEWKPSVCKMVLDFRSNALVVHVDPAINQPWRAEPYYSALKSMVAQGLKDGSVVMVLERRRTIILLPDRDVDMGVLPANARFQLKREMTAEGMKWQARAITPPEIVKK